MSSKEAMLATLGEMGFTGNRAARGLKATDYRGVEPAMEWLLSHADDELLDQPLTEEEATDWTASATNNEEEAPARKPLTEEERKEKLQKLEELRVQKRKEREERERIEAKEKEKKRIKEGQGMSEIKQALAEQEIKKMAELRRREKQETKEAKAKILAQIEADKMARKKKFNMEGSEDAATPTPAPPLAAAAVTPAPKKDYNDARLQIRQSNGQPLVHTFGSKEPLSAVRLYVQMNRTDGGVGEVKLMTNFPKKVFSDDDYDNTLENLGLTPSAVLIVTK